jgi:hypothetical protein
MTERTTWEYRVLDGHQTKWLELLNQLGAEGWEAVAALEPSDGYAVTGERSSLAGDVKVRSLANAGVNSFLLKRPRTDEPGDPVPEPPPTS